MIGHVSLVGAGPGAADLLTVRAVRRLGEADLVLYDALAAQIPRTVAPEARWFFVGKRAGREAIPQEALGRLMVRQARRGLCVVRLKGGDPFVLGRGGEEARALAAAGIPFEVIPGLSSALAAPALANVPLTHRGLASGFVVLSAHADEGYAAVVDSIPPASLTLVFMMGIARRQAIAARLIARGWQPDTPAAILLGVSTPDERRWLGRLADLAVFDARGDLPGIVVVGPVVALAAELDRVARTAAPATEDATRDGRLAGAGAATGRAHG